MHLRKYEMNGKENVYALVNLAGGHLSIELYETIDEDIMLAAVKEAINYHPLFGTRIIFENGRYYFEENPEPPVIFSADNAPTIYGTEVNNHYPWIIVIQDKQMLFYATHALADGSGMFSFCKTVLHAYFQLTGVAFADTVTDFPVGSPEETMENGYLRYADPACEALCRPKPFNPVNVEPHWFELKDQRPWRLEIPLTEVRRFAKESETSVFSVIACILARTMADAFNIQSGNIYIRVPVNLRSFFPSATDRNFAQGFSLCYMTERMNNMPDAKVETIFRSQLDLRTDKSNLMQFINADNELLEGIKAGPEKFREVLEIEKLYKPVAEIVYTHITKPGFSEELTEKIRDIHMDFNAIQEGLIFVSGVTINSNVCLTIQQCSRNDCFMDSLRKVLNKREIAYKLYQFDLPPAYTCHNTSELVENGYL